VQLRLLVVGKPARGPEAELLDRYARRIEALGVGWRLARIAAERPGGRFDDDHVREREAHRLAERLDGRGTLVALDARGESLTSERLARRLERWGTPCGTFAIGGPLGLHASLLDRADARWSLSRLTLPHELAAAVLAEQLYRAVTILRGVPYHK